MPRFAVATSLLLLHSVVVEVEHEALDAHLRAELLTKEGDWDLTKFQLQNARTEVAVIAVPASEIAIQPAA